MESSISSPAQQYCWVTGLAPLDHRSNMGWAALVVTPAQTPSSLTLMAIPISISHQPQKVQPEYCLGTAQVVFDSLPARPNAAPSALPGQILMAIVNSTW